jgi:DNA-binding NtrC family response regulator
LENAIEHALALSGDRTLLLPHDFPLPAPVRTRPAESPASARPSVAIPEDGCDFEYLVGSFELQLLEQALRKANGNKTQAAEMLKLKRTTLTAKLKSLEASAGRDGL